MRNFKMKMRNFKRKMRNFKGKKINKWVHIRKIN